MDTKTCRTCKSVKPVGSFYACKSNADRLFSDCKQCVIEQQTAYHKRKQKDVFWLATYREKMRVWAANYRASGKAKRYNNGRAVAWAKRNPEKHRAQWMAREAVKKGLIPRLLNCEKCGSSELLQKHHADYSKPLEVVWLCIKCHHAVHKKSPFAPIIPRTKTTNRTQNTYVRIETVRP